MLTSIEEGSKELKSLDEMRSVSLTSYERWCWSRICAQLIPGLRVRPSVAAMT